MNKLKILNVMAVLSAIILLSACKDDDEAPSKSAILSSKNWNLTKVEETLDGTTVNATDEWLLACDADDVIKFKAGGIYEESPGADDCNGDDEVYTGTWALTSSDTKINMVIDGDTEVYNIVSLDGSKFVVETDEFTDDWDGDGDEETVVIRFTFTAK
jgi:hypothetical protein